MPASRTLAWLILAALLVPAASPLVGAQEIDQPPTVEIDEPEPGATVNDTTVVEGNASDLEGNLSRVEVRIDDGPWTNATGTSNWTYSWDTTQQVDGDHTVHARSYDGENYSDVATRNVTVDNGGNGSDGGGDNQAPTVTIDEPTEQATVNGTIEVRGTASDADGNVTQVRVRVDDAPWTEATGTDSWSSTWDTTTASDGEHTITVEATDDDNGTATAQRTVTVDNGGNESGDETQNEAPSVTIDEPTEGADVNGTIEVRGTASDADGNVTEVQARIDGGFWNPADGTEAWSFTWDTTSISEGRHEITVRAVDDAGAETTATINVTVANGEQPSQPTVEIEEPSPNATVNGSVSISGTASDPDGSIENVEVRIGQSDWRSARGTDSWGLRWNVSDFDAREYEIQVRAIDDDGNQANASRTVQIEESEPLTATGAGDLGLTLSSPEDGESVEDELEIAGEVEGVDDPDAAIRVSYQIDEGRSRVIGVRGGGSFEETVNVSTLSPGEHELTAKAIHGDRSSDAHTKSFEVQGADEESVASPQIGLALLVVAVLAAGGLILWARR